MKKSFVYADKELKLQYVFGNKRKLKNGILL
jgi:hypothetical protein